MAFPTTSVLDSFNRADGALAGGSWSADPFGTTNGGPSIAGNAVAVQTFGKAAWWNVGTFGPDCEVFATVGVKPPDGAGWLQLLARIQGPGANTADGYKVELGPASGTDSVDVYRVVNGVDTAIGASIAQEFAAGDKLGMEVLGTGATVTINIYRHNGTSWSLIGTRSDTNAARIVTTGYIGLGGYQTSTDTMRIDDFGGGVVAAGVQGGPSSGSMRFLTAATGQKTGKAAATGQVRFVGAVTGIRSQAGAATGSVRFITSATGRKTAFDTHEEASALPPFTVLVPGSVGLVRFLGSAAGAALHGGAAAGSVRFVTSAAGRKQAGGAAAGVVRFLTAATGAANLHGGPSAGVIRFQTSAAGRKSASAPASTTIRLLTTATGRKTASGSAAGLVRFVGTASGTSTTPRMGPSSGTIRFVTQATGYSTRRSAAAGTVRFFTAATGHGALSAPSVSTRTIRGGGRVTIGETGRIIRMEAAP